MREPPLLYLLTPAPSADRRDRIDFIEEDDAGGRGLRLAEGLSDRALRFSDPFAQEFRPADGDEVRLRLRGDRLREQRLARPRRSVQHDAAWRARIEVSEQLVHLQRPFDRFPELLLCFVESADVLPSHVRPLDEDFPQCRWLEFPVRLEAIVARDLE